jgi:hypothetical protein
MWAKYTLLARLYPGSYYPLDTTGIVSRVYNILWHTKECKQKQYK